MPDDKSTVKVFVEMLARHFVQEQTASAGLMAFDTNWIEHAFLCRGVGSKQPLVKIRFKCVEQRPKIEPLGVLDIHQYGRNSGEDIFRERIFPQSADVRRSPNKQVRNRVNQAIDIVSLRRFCFVNCGERMNLLRPDMVNKPEFALDRKSVV